MKDYGNKSKLVLSDEKREHKSEEISSSSTGTGGFSLFGILKMGGSSGYYNSRQSDYDFQSKSFIEQLKEINAHSESCVHFDFDGRVVRPKSLNVSRILRNRLEKNLTFNRILKIITEANFRELISLTTDEFRAVDLVQESLFEIKNAMNSQLKMTNESVEGGLDQVRTEQRLQNENMHCLVGLQENNGSRCRSLKSYSGITIYGNISYFYYFY